MKRQSSSSKALHPAFLALLVPILFLMGCKNEVTNPPTTPVYWQTFNKGNTPMKDDYIHDISVDNDGKVWLATRDGAWFYDNGNWGSVHDSLMSIISLSGGFQDTSYSVNSITHAKDRAVWFALGGGGVVRYQPLSDRSVWKRFNQDNGAFDFPLSIVADREVSSLFGEIWVASASGVNQYVQSVNETGRWYAYRKGDGTSTLPSNQVWVAAIKADDNTIWFGAQAGGAAMAAYSVSGTLSWNSFPFPPALDSKINSIAFDLSNTIWFGTLTQGVLSFTRGGDGTWTQYNHLTPGGKLPEGSVNAVLTDYLRTRWFGTDAGLVRLKDTVWTQFTRATPKVSLASDTITALRYDTRNNLWIGTPNGVSVYNPDGIRY